MFGSAVWRVRSRPPTPQEAIDAIGDQVSALEESGPIEEGEATALTSKLDSALARLEKGKPKEAANILGAFVKQVEALIKSGRVSQADGQALIDAARRIVETL